MIDGKELIVSFSGGKDSTAMLHLLLERGRIPDEVVFFDGGWEFPQMYDHLELVEQKTGIKITRLKPDNPFDYYAAYHQYYGRKRKDFRIGYGFPGARSRWCTRIKCQTIDAYFMGRSIITAIGFAVGEERRLKGAYLDKERFIFPLMDYDFDEIDALEYCYKLGYHWDGLYKYMSRVSCFCCPLTGTKEAFNICRHIPEVWQMIGEKERKFRDSSKGGRATQLNWRHETSWEELNERFKRKGNNESNNETKE